MKHQRGVGMIEVLVSIIILSIGVFSMIMLTYRSLEATTETSQRINSILIAREIGEKIRSNRDGFDNYKLFLSEDNTLQKKFSKNCYGKGSQCSVKEIADFDVAQSYLRAEKYGVSMNMRDCVGNKNQTQCLYLAWDNTNPTHGSSKSDCTIGTGGYNPSSRCLVVEIY